MLIKSVFNKESEEVVAGEAKSGSSGKMVQCLCTSKPTTLTLHL
jgi:hypothetical protein